MRVPDFALLTVALSGLMGCRVDAEVRLYTSDMLSAARDDQPSVMPLKVFLEVPSRQVCEEEGPAIADALMKFDPSMDHIGCEKRGLSDLAHFSASAEVVPSGPHVRDLPKASSLLRIIVGPIASKECSPTTCTMAAMLAPPHRLDELRQAVATAINNPMVSQQRVDDLVVRIVIDNDLKSAVGLQVADAFVNNRAYSNSNLAGPRIPIPRRQSAEVRLSDVATSLLSEGTWYMVGTVEFSEAK